MFNPFYDLHNRYWWNLQLRPLLLYSRDATHKQLWRLRPNSIRVILEESDKFLGDISQVISSKERPAKMGTIQECQGLACSLNVR
jgi:hypothetical protein